MRSVTRHLILALCASSLLAAQNEEDGQTNKARGRTAWFVATSTPEGLENPITVLSGKDLIEITLSKRSASEAVKIPQDGILRVVRKTDKPVKPGELPYITLAQATVAEGIHKALVILVPNGKQGDERIFNTAVHDLSKFKGGDWMFLNLANVNVAVDMGKTNLEVKPGQTRIFDSPPLNAPIDMPIRYRFFHPVQKEWKMLSASTIMLYPTRREICIFSVDPFFKRLEYHGITFPPLE